MAADNKRPAQEAAAPTLSSPGGESILNDPRVALGGPPEPSAVTIDVAKGGPPSTLQSLATDAGAGGNAPRLMKASLDVPDQDLGARYTAERGQAQAQAASPDAWFDSLISQPGTAPPTNPSSPAGSGAPSGETPPQDAGQNNQGRLFDPNTAWGRWLGPIAAGVVRYGPVADAVSGDLARGAIETPGSVVRGATTAVNETANTVGAFAGWLYDNAPDAIKGGPLDLIAEIRKTDPAFQPGDAAAQLPQLFAERASGTGKTVEFTAQWLTSQALVGKVSKALGVPAGTYKKILDAFGAGATGFDPRAPRLSNVIDGVAPNPLTDFLKANADDPELLARLKAGLETAGLQAATDGVLKAFQVLRAALHNGAGVQPGAGTPAPTAGGAEAVPSVGSVPKVIPKSIMLEGDLPSGTAVYHGTNVDFSGPPDLARAGAVSGITNEPAFWVTTSRESAGKFAKMADGDVVKEFSLDAKKIRSVEYTSKDLSSGTLADIKAREIAAATKEGADAVVFRMRDANKLFNVPDEIAVLNTRALAARSTPPIVLAAQDNSQFADKAAKFLAGTVPDAPIQVNLDRFDGPDRIKQAIGDLSKLLPPAKSIPMEETLARARALGLDVGDPASLDARQIAAKWMLVHSSAAQLPELGARAAATGAPEDIARLNAATQMAYGILREAKGQSSDIARALQIHNALRKSEPDMVKALQKMIDETGGNAVSLDFAAKIASLKDPAEVQRFLEELPKATTRDKLTFAWSNILLSNPATHVANVGDTSVTTLYQVPETWFASKFGGNVAEGEATARLYGIAKGFKDGLRLAWRTMQTGESRYRMPQRTELPVNANAPLPSSEDLLTSGPTRQFADWLKMLMPTRLMAAGDELTKTMNFRGEAAALAWRKAAIDQGLAGPEAQAYATQLLNDMPDWLSEAAQAQAIKGTYNQPLEGSAKFFAQMVDAANIPIPGTDVKLPVGRVIVPFLRTPVNLMRWSFARTPLAFLSPSVMSDIAAGGAARDAALARIASGSAIMAAFADLTLSGRVSGVGPKDPALRADLARTGWQPYSIHVGDRWIGYNRSGTFGMLIGLAADATELLTGVYTRQKDTLNIDGTPVDDSVAASVTMPFAGAILSKTWMSGLAGLVDALSDPTRYGESWIQRTVSSVVPSGIAAIERAVDPEIRRASNWLEAIQARIPGLSSSLPPRLDLWGQPIKDENGLYGIFVPARFSSDKGTAADREIARMKLEAMPPKQVQDFSRGGVSLQIKLSPEQQNRLIALAGNELKLSVPGVAQPIGAHDYLDAVIEGRAGAISQRYAAAGDDLRGQIVKDVISRFRMDAKEKLIAGDPDLRALITSSLQSKAQQLRAPRPAAAPAGGGSGNAPTLQ